MCEDHATRGLAATTSQLSRRGFLHGTAAVAAGAALLPGKAGRELPARLPLHSAARPADAIGRHAYSMAMHIHSSFSEFQGSMDSQLYQAARNAVDVLWWTDHDSRMDGLGFRKVVHFTSLDKEEPAPGQGEAWHWQQQRSGRLTSQSGGGIVQDPCSPYDPVQGGAMSLAAQSAGPQAAAYGFYANSQPSQWNYRDNLTGQSLSIDVLLNWGWTEGYLEILIGTSYHQASAGRPAGEYALSYRLVPAPLGGSAHASGNTGVITIPVDNSRGWVTVTITPSDDIGALWPDLDHRDFALFELSLNAVSTGELVSGYFDYLRFDRSISGETFLDQQAKMAAALDGKYPSVSQQQGLEVSWQYPHLNWFGGQVRVPQYGTLPEKKWEPYLAGTLVPEIHKAGGLVSYNHPFGAAFATDVLPKAEQNRLLTQAAAALLGNTALGCDLLEVGYTLRAGVDLHHHVALWDVMSRNANFLTGNGASDDHWGEDWRREINNWVTSVWAASAGQRHLLAGLASGQAWTGSLSGFNPAAGATLNLLVDGKCPMGSVSVARVRSRSLAVTATGIPSGGSVQVLQGAVDYAGEAGLSSNVKRVASYSAARMDRAGGQVTLPVDTSADSFIRTEVLDGTGKVVGLSNPVWLLRRQPPGGIPAARQA